MLRRLRAIGLMAITVGTVLGSGGALGQPGQAPRPPLLFKEEWRMPKHEGAATDENTRFTPEVAANERIEAHLYGPGSAPVRAAEHEGRVDLWNGLATSPVAVTLRDKRNYVDLSGLARLRWIVRTNAIHTLYPIVKLADGTLVVGDRAITTAGEFVQVEIAFGGMRWYKVDPQKLIVLPEVKNPDLARVDEVGLISLQPGGGHGIAGSFNLSTVELYAKTVAR
ncbi:MAG TPA: hypothetical protein VFP91_10025 [Vicinamibacterales bacterium]|nr:hypothetical protein [Vicinamibacterales bacterium]